MSEESEQGAVEHSLESHSRAITDINFSAHHPDMLATCGVDGYVNCWDLRRPRQPVLGFCDWFSGATQVKYSRQDPHVIASSHDCWVHIWDDRRTVEPLRSINAHSSKIYGIDWNRTRAAGIVTCSVDRSIKFWDYTNPLDVPERVIRTDFPVWRARHTPFGCGLLAMPQDEPGYLYLYERRLLDDTPVDGFVEPVKVFEGHGQHKAREFLWRSRGGVDDNGLDNRDFQLVSWGEDNLLRLKKLDADVLAKVGYEKGKPVQKNLNFTRKGAAYKTFRIVDDMSLDHGTRKSATMSDTLPGTAGEMAKRGIAGTLKTGWKGRPMRARAPSRKDANKTRAQIGWMSGITMSKRKPSADTKPRRTDSKDSSLFEHGFPDDEWAGTETIHEELLRISKQLPNVKWDGIDVDSLVFNASVRGPWGVGGDPIFIRVRVDVPPNYPESRRPPTFTVEKTSLMPDETHATLQSELAQMARQFAGRQQNCLEVAFTYLLGEVDLATSTSWLKNLKELDFEEDGEMNLVEPAPATAPAPLLRSTTGFGDDSSSSDDDDNGVLPPEASALISQEIGHLGDSDVLDYGRRVTNVPPRLAGARFASDGRLVCFFAVGGQLPQNVVDPPKTFTTIGADNDALSDRPGNRGQPKLAGFGRLPQERSLVHTRRRKDDTAGSDNGVSAASDVSESEMSASSSEDSDPVLEALPRMTMWYQPMPVRRFKNKWTSDQSAMSSGGAGTGGADTAIFVGTGGGDSSTKHEAALKRRSAVAIHDFAFLLPSKKELAREYAIFGDGPDVCDHNATVASKHGYPDLANVWTYCGLLLKKGIPLELLDQRQREESILVIARDTVARTRQHDEKHASSGHHGLSLSGRVKWGRHPLAVPVVRGLFDYFEQLADVQMLAMLSCIFSETSAEDNSIVYADEHLPQPDTPLPMKAPSFSLDYFPSEATLFPPVQAHGHHRSQASSSGFNTPRTSHTPLYYVGGSHGSDEPAGLWKDDPGSNSYSAGETPPSRSSALRQVAVSVGNRKAQSLSSSPNTNSKLLQRANSILGMNLPFASAGPTSSPPKKKGPSSTTGAGVTWGASTIFGTATSKPVHGAGSVAFARTGASDDESDVTEDDHGGTALVCVGIAIRMEDQTEFDDDGWMTVPMLDPARRPNYAAYRYAYAQMLQLWGEPLARLEVLKFNVLKEVGDESGPDDAGHELRGILRRPSVAESIDGGSSASSGRRTPANGQSATARDSKPSDGGLLRAHDSYRPEVRKRRHLQALARSGRGLDIVGRCPLHDMSLYPLQYFPPPNSAADDEIPAVGGAAGYCEKCARLSRGVAGAAAATWAAHVLSMPSTAGNMTPGARFRMASAAAATAPPRRAGDYWDQLRCVYCREPVDALFPPCLACGCASHDACLAEWHAAGETLCPAGDDCNCVEEASNGEVEWAAVRAAMIKKQLEPRPQTQNLPQAQARGVRGAVPVHQQLHHRRPEKGQMKQQPGAGAASRTANTLLNRFLGALSSVGLGGGGGSRSTSTNTAAAPTPQTGTGNTTPTTSTPPSRFRARHHSVPSALEATNGGDGGAAAARDAAAQAPSHANTERKPRDRNHNPASGSGTTPTVAATTQTPSSSSSGRASLELTRDQSGTQGAVAIGPSGVGGSGISAAADATSSGPAAAAALARATERRRNRFTASSSTAAGAPTGTASISEASTGDSRVLQTSSALVSVDENMPPIVHQAPSTGDMGSSGGGRPQSKRRKSAGIGPSWKK